MAITENEILHLKKGEHSYLLLKSPDRFHMIHEDAALTEAKFDRLLRLYPCDDTQLKKLGLHFTAFKADSLQGIMIRGYQLGDVLEVWFYYDYRTYQLGKDYTAEDLSAFFSGVQITERLPKKWEGFDIPLIRKITWSFTGISIACALLFSFLHTPYRLWSSLCLLCYFIAIALPLLYPASFTLEEEPKYGYSDDNENKNKGHLLYAMVAVGIALCVRTLWDFSFTDFTIGFVMVGVFILSIIVLVLSIWYKKGPRNGLLNAFATIIAVTFLSFGVIGQLNYLLDIQSAQSYVAEVSDKYVSEGTKSDDYYCIVKQPDGKPLELSLSGWRYNDIEIGDELTVIHHDGAFGIPFYTTSLHTGDQVAIR